PPRPTTVRPWGVVGVGMSAGVMQTTAEAASWRTAPAVSFSTVAPGARRRGARHRRRGETPMHSRRADATASHTHRWAALLAAVLALVAALVPTTPAAAADIPGAITGVDITQESAAYGGSVDVRM